MVGSTLQVRIQEVIHCSFHVQLQALSGGCITARPYVFLCPAKAKISACMWSKLKDGYSAKQGMAHFFQT